ncbi:DUF559 domain-containing protein [Mumia zhuanghuii]|uniref:Endonuclease domain-containing protein n=2 Tax=Mumia TaxID=1546255 RepID=A0ABW1QL73_9ACTN|nr:MULTISPECIES: DUF559 domain-containing protein [Mumia]KAA1424975.1 DUF559 domain-containing protein [Mumia zhuanghuii]
MKPIPDALASRPFTLDTARRHGFARQDLSGTRFRRVLRGVYAVASLADTLVLTLRAAILLLPDDAVASHLTALRLWGLELRALFPLHFSTNTTRVCERSDLRLHRRRGRLRAYVRHRIACTGPDRTYVDCGTILNLVEFVMTAEHLIHQSHTALADLRAYLDQCHIDGVVRARRAFAYVRERVESPMETLVRLALVFARLPEPDPNPDVLDAAGRFVARCDLVYWKYRVIVEYDGAWHERSKKQRARDRTRREALERLGWTVIVVLEDDLANKKAIVWRVYGALRDNGYDGPRPHFNAMWTRWFASHPSRPRSGQFGYESAP